MAVFTWRRAGAVTAVDTATVSFFSALAATTRALRVQELSFSGLGTASAATEITTAATIMRMSSAMPTAVTTESNEKMMSTTRICTAGPAESLCPLYREIQTRASDPTDRSR